MTHKEILLTLSDAITAADRSGKYGLADRLMEVIVTLKRDWFRMEDDGK